MGFKTTFNYCVNLAARDCMNPATGTGYVTVTDPDGNTTIDDYTQGALAAETHLTAGTLTSEHDYNPITWGGVANAGTLLDASETDGNGNTTAYTYNQAGEQTSASGPSAAGGTGTTTGAYTNGYEEDCDGDAEAASSATCAQDTGPAPVAPGGVITPPSSAPPEGLDWTLYDTAGHELYTTAGVYSPAGSFEHSQTTYNLYQGNSVTLPGTTTAITCSSNPPSAALPCATINADGVVTQMTYDSQGDLIQKSIPDGQGSQLAVTSYEYDADGEQVSTTSPDGYLSGANAGNYTTTTNFNADGQRTSVTQGDGSGYTDTPRSTSYGYDANGNKTSATDALKHTASTAYNADNQPVLVTNPDGDSTLTCYTPGGGIAETVPAAGVAAKGLTATSCPVFPASYNPQTVPMLATDATMYVYNARGQKTAVYSPAPAGQTGSETTSYTYDGNGNPLTTTAPPISNGGNSQVTVDTYNNAGELATQTTGYGTAAAATTSYCYNADGNQTSVVAADGNTSGVAPCNTNPSYPDIVDPTAYGTQAAYQTISTYDSAGEMLSTTSPADGADPDGATITYSYDPEGNALTSTSPGGVTTTWTYTPDDQHASMSFSGSSAHSVTYVYDAEDNLTSMSDVTGTSTWVYDNFGEVTSEQDGAGNMVTYGYNADGRGTNITYPLPSAATWAKSDTVTFGYDNAGYLTAVTDFNGHQINVTDTADGLPSAMSLGSTGDTINTSYGNSAQPQQISLTNSTSTLESLSYADAPAGNILTETDTPTSAQSPAVYTYDANSRVTSMTAGTGPAQGYGYDASGNLTTLPAGASATYNKARELTSSTLSGATADYTYNADGDRLTAAQGSTTTASAAWNGADQLTGYSDPAASMTAATYDGSGQRASATLTPAGGTATTEQFTWGPSNELLEDSTNAYIYAAPGTPAEQVNLSTGATSYLVTDTLGSVRGIVGSSGAVAATTAYDAWGNPETTGGLTSQTPFGFAGGYTDPTGLIYLINRYYDPQTGQFLSVDPDVAQTADPYGYAAGDPVNLTDPSGDRPRGNGYIFLIGQTFTAQEGQDFVWGICSVLVYGQDCNSQFRFQTPYGIRITDVFGGETLYEVKTGYQSGSPDLRGQARKDNWLLNDNGGWGGGRNNRGLFWQVTGASWWFLPGQSRTSGSSVSFFQQLSNFGINILWFIYKRGQNDSDYNYNYNEAWMDLTNAAGSSVRISEVYKYFPSNDGFAPGNPCLAGNFWVYA